MHLNKFRVRNRSKSGAKRFEKIQFCEKKIVLQGAAKEGE
jgi:hypothetical protein